jgi:hypothetical protein
MTEDPLLRLEHDHTDLSRRVAELRDELPASRRDPARRAELMRELGELTEDLFEHFAREEEGLFPFIARVLPDLEPAVASLAAAHDRICGAASRLTALEHRAPNPALDLAAVMFARFDAEYVEHARRESEFLRSLANRVDARHRDELAAILRTL